MRSCRKIDPFAQKHLDREGAFGWAYFDFASRPNNKPTNSYEIELEMLGLRRSKGKAECVCCGDQEYVMDMQKVAGQVEYVVWCIYGSCTI